MHGGPGDVQSPYVTTDAPYEKDFVLVQWEAIGTREPKDAKQYFGRSRPIRRFLPAADTGWFTRMEKEALANGETDLSKVEAPAKRLVVIDGAGHFALTTHQSDVIAAFRQTAH